ncbi:MAG: hypothetical protein Q7V05_04365 [Methanoregula sp.]|nr:hypothetical protein [Methanoregula sp.]
MKIILCLLLFLVLLQGVQAAETYTFVTKWGTQGSGGDGQFNEPYGVAVDSSGSVYVADAGNHRIQKFSSTGSFLTKWGTLGSTDGQFSNPSGVAVDSSGNVYVADTNNNRIQKFSSSGSFLAKWGTVGTGDGQLDNPTGVAVDSSGNVYVADQINNRIQKFSSSGSFLAKWGTQGSGDDQFWQPTGVAVDSSGNVYVADLRNNRIQKFSSTGTFLIKWGGIYGTGDGQFEYPGGVAVDSSGNVYVADSGNNRIQKFSSTGTFLIKWGGAYGTGDGQFYYPYGITVDSSGNVYVADTSNHRIQKFAPQIITPTPTPTTIATTVPTTSATTIQTTVSTTSATTVSTTSATTAPTTSTATIQTTIPTTVPITVTPTPIAPAYVAGDIIGTSYNPDQAWLIMSYDTSPPIYGLAEIFQYPNGTWGYRHDSDLVTYKRILVETVFPQKLAHVSLSSIPIVTPTPIPKNVATVTPQPAKKLFITINSIEDKYSGEKFTITGSTNIPVDNPLQIRVTSSKQTQTSGLSGLVTGTSNVLKGIGGTNIFSFDVDASTFNPDEYIVKVSGSGDNIAVTSRFAVIAGIRPANLVTIPTITPSPSITSSPTSSVEKLLEEQNKKIDEQNKLIAEQNKKMAEQSDLLSQMLNYFKGIFGWKYDNAAVTPTQIPVTSPTRTSTPTPTTITSVTPKPTPEPTTQTIPIVTPTIPPTVIATLSGSAPTVTGISPASGAKDAVVGVRITGTNFESGATAKLTRAGYPSIAATGVSVSSVTSIGCTFNLASDLGSYNVMVTNPSGQSNTKMAAFSIDEAPQIVYVTVLVTPTPTQTPNPTPVTTTLATLTPALTPGSTQTLPDMWSLDVQVVGNGEAVNPQIITTVMGGNGLSIISQLDVKVTRSDGIVETGVIVTPLYKGKSVSLPSTTAPGYRDRAEIWATTPQGDKVKIYDAYVPFRTYN